MNTHWKTFLASRAAEIDERGAVCFPTAPASAECALADLTHLGLIAVTGPDAMAFLQGQLTNDVRELSARHTQLSGYCSPKGRMLASFRVFRIGETIYLQLPHHGVDALVQRLRMFLLRSKATVEKAGDDLVAIGIAGECAEGLLREHFAALPAQAGAMACSAELVAIRVPGPVPRFEILGPAPAMTSLWDQLATGATVVNPPYWALLDIRAGIPSVFPETADAFVPQMANMQLIDGVSFTKGCYAGQEVVARMQYLGKLKRRMYLAEVSTDTPPRPGDELHADGSRSEQAGGRVVDARRNADGRYELLAVVEIAAAETGEVRLGPHGPILAFKAPPYGWQTAS